MNPLAYTLVIDQDRDIVLNVMMSFCGHTDNINSFIAFIQAEGKAREFKSLVEEISEKSHEHGWCPEPEDCEWVPKDKKP